MEKRNSKLEFSEEDDITELGSAISIIKFDPPWLASRKYSQKMVTITTRPCERQPKPE
jgi:hypothetical protein